jgi:hypothetical protein
MISKHSNRCLAPIPDRGISIGDEIGANAKQNTVRQNCHGDLPGGRFLKIKFTGQQ